MKVLKTGNPQGTWSKEIECTGAGNGGAGNGGAGNGGAGNGGAGCGALLEVVADDLFHTQTTFCGRDQQDYITIECPQCKTWTDFSSKDKIMVPYGIRSKVMGMFLSTTGKPPVRS